MYRALIGAAVLVLAVGAGLHAQNQASPLDAPTTLRLPVSLPACGINTVLMKLARTSRVATGFEETRDCRGRFPRVDVAYDADGQTTMTVRQLLDRLVALTPDYAWRDMHGVAVVRPAPAWADASDALNARMASFTFADTTLSETVAAILRVPPRESHLDAQHFTLAFKGGTLADALNALVLARGGVGWKVGVLYHGSPDTDPSPSLQVGIWTFNAGDRAPLDGALGMGTPLPRFLSGK